jgi:hypothetical protein
MIRLFVCAGGAVPLPLAADLVQGVHDAALDFEDFGVGPAGSVLEHGQQIGRLLKGALGIGGECQAGFDRDVDLVFVGQVRVVGHFKAVFQAKVASLTARLARMYVSRRNSCPVWPTSIRLSC